MRNIVCFMFAILALSSCNKATKFKGFSKSRKGFYYQLHTFGESNLKASTGDYITTDIAYSTLEDSIFFEGRRKIKLSKPAYKGSIEDCFRILNEDESASFLLFTEPFFRYTLETDVPEFLKQAEYFKIKINIVEIQTTKEFENEKEAFLNWIEDFGDYEKVILNQYLSDEKLSLIPDSSGLLYLALEEGKGPKIEAGDTITINYEGRFLNGKFFDSTVRRKQPFQFVFGTEWQVIEGLEKGLVRMSEGDKALIILPSELAFGQTGSSTGIVPPFTSLIFEVEILKVSKGIGYNKKI